MASRKIENLHSDLPLIIMQFMKRCRAGCFDHGRKPSLKEFHMNDSCQPFS